MKYYSQYIEACKLNKRKNSSKALEMFYNLYNYEPDNDLINLGIAMSLINIHKKNISKDIELQIREHLKKAEVRGIVELGNLEKRLENIGLALKRYKKAIKFGNNIEAYYNLILLEIEQGDLISANEYFQKFYEITMAESEKLTRFDSKCVKRLNLLAYNALQLGKFEFAIELFNKVLLYDDYNYKDSVLEGLMYAYNRLEKPEESYQNYLEYKKSYELYDKRILLYILFKLNRLDEFSKMNHTYLKKQLLNYCCKEAILHIKENHGDQFIGEIENIFNACCEKIKNSYPIESWSCNDKYLVDFENNIGVTRNNLTNRVRVIVIPNTKNIITMYPYPPKIESLDIKKFECKNIKIKRLTQIEKFNRKYE